MGLTSRKTALGRLLRAFRHLVPDSCLVALGCADGGFNW